MLQCSLSVAGIGKRRTVSLRSAHIILRSGFIALSLLLSCSIFDIEPQQPAGRTEAKIIVLSDLHYYAPSLGTTGLAFEEFERLDGKMIRQSDALLRAAVDAIKIEDPDLVLITGDLVNTGEKISHEKVASYLAELEQSGITVLIAPGNHDINNPHAQSFNGSSSQPEQNISPQEFEQIYFSYGFDIAIARDPGSLSYIAEPLPGVAIVSIDACQYSENISDAIPDAKLTDETKAWIYSQIEKSSEKGLVVLGMMHHGVAEHFIGQSQGFPAYIVPDWQDLTTQFASRGMRAIFTGHFHAQDIVGIQTKAGYLYDIETGSLATFPHCMRKCLLTEDNQLMLDKMQLQSIDYDLGGEDLLYVSKQSLSRALMEQGIPALVAKYGLNAEQVSAITPLALSTLLAHYAGDENPSQDVLSQIALLAIDPDPLLRNAALLFSALWTDLEPADNKVTISLN